MRLRVKRGDLHDVKRSCIFQMQVFEAYNIAELLVQGR